MLNNIVFKDNIFLLSRILSLLLESLKLDFAEELFVKKIESDILFSNEAINRIYEKLTPQEHLHDYLDSMKCLYSCSLKFLQVLDDVTTSDKSLFCNSLETINDIKKQNEEIRASICKKINNTSVDAEAVNIVSDLEMTKLLNFENEN